MKINFISKAFDRFNRYLTPHVSNAAKSSMLHNAELVSQKETNLVKATVEELNTKEAKACNSFSAEEAIKYTIAPKEVARPQKCGKAKAILNKKFNENIPEYSNAEVIRILKNISGEGLEVAEKSKNIFLKELGFPENFVEMEFGKNINGDIIAYFDIASGKMVYGNNFLKLSKNEQISYIRHELDHTAYLTHKKSAVFSIYIGTEPGNIETSINGFKEEIEKIKNIPVGEEELHNAKNNLIGKQQFISETNAQQANMMAYYSIMGKPFEYQKEVIAQLKAVTSEQLQECANKYFTDDYVLSIIKP